MQDLFARGSQESSPTPEFKCINSSVLSFFYGSTLTSTHDYWKNHSFDYLGLCRHTLSLLFKMLSRLVIAFLPRGKRLLISWLQSLSAVIFGAQESKVCHYFHCFPSVCHEVMGLGTMILVFLNIELLKKW